MISKSVPRTEPAEPHSWGASSELEVIPTQLRARHLSQPPLTKCSAYYTSATSIQSSPPCGHRYDAISVSHGSLHLPYSFIRLSSYSWNTTLSSLTIHCLNYSQLFHPFQILSSDKSVVFMLQIGSTFPTKWTSCYLL